MIATGCADCLCQLLPALAPFLTPLVIVATAIAAWRVQLNILARRTAWDYIAEHQLQSDYILTANKAVRALAGKTEQSDWEELAARWSQGTLTDEDEKLTTPIFEWLNRKEFAAIAILNKSMHAQTYATWWGAELIHEWNRAKGFVYALRPMTRGDDDLYSNFERLATSPTFRQLAKWKTPPPASA